MEQGQQSDTRIKENIRKPFHVVIEPIALDKLPAHPCDVRAEPKANGDVVDKLGRLLPGQPGDSDLQKQRGDGNEHSEFYPHVAP